MNIYNIPVIWGGDSNSEEDENDEESIELDNSTKILGLKWRKTQIRTKRKPTPSNQKITNSKEENFTNFIAPTQCVTFRSRM